MIISYEREFIFLKTQKTGGTSVEIALSGFCGPRDVLTRLAPDDEALRNSLGRRAQNYRIPKLYRPRWGTVGERLGIDQANHGYEYRVHMPAKVVRARMDAAIFDRFRKLTIVRNPWDREVSLYYWHIRGKKNPPTFARFVRRRLNNPERKTFKIYSIDGRIVATDVLRYENLADDYAKFVRSLGMPDAQSLPVTKGAHRPKVTRNYRDQYDEAARKIVARRYAREIAAFGYTF